MKEILKINKNNYKHEIAKKLELMAEPSDMIKTKERILVENIKRA
jgi:hypothetical protein